MLCGYHHVVAIASCSCALGPAARYSAQNRRQKVFNRGALRFCGGDLGLCVGLDILKIDEHSTDL